MPVQLDLADIQGNVLTAYGKLGFPKGRFLLFQVIRADAGRGFIEMLRPWITTALRWESSRRPHLHGPVQQARPEVTVNLAFTFMGLYALGVPTRTLRDMPDEFIDGMEARANIIGDDVPTNPRSNWDQVWRTPAGGRQPVHILVSLNAQMQSNGMPVPALATMTERLLAFCAGSDGGIRLLPGHAGPNPDFQEAAALLRQDASGVMQPLPVEHFGYRDGISDPVFNGQYPPEREAEHVAGNGKLTPQQTWEPLATGEFLLGYPDEAQEQAGMAMPIDFSRNGTFMAYRKLHQNVVAFRRYLATTSAAFATVYGIPLAQAPETLMAKIAGRWPDGVPLVLAPTYGEWQAIKARRATAQAANDTATIAAMERDLTRFLFRQDPDGSKCPFSAHIRRANTRDMLDPHFASANPSEWNGSVLNNRRRILRRGLPYGSASPDAPDDSGEHGIVMLIVCASLFRQFEFVQQQWIQYGLDFFAGNDTCPLIGNHGPEAKFVIAADPKSGRPPFICDRPPQFVETRGGEYFFVPSMTALRMIGTGVIDPT